MTPSELGHFKAAIAALEFYRDAALLIHINLRSGRNEAVVEAMQRLNADNGCLAAATICHIELLMSKK